MKIGVNNLVNFGLLWTGLSTVALGMVEFIPHDQGMWFAVCGFAIRTSTGMGTSATLQGALTILSDDFVEHRGMVMVG